MIFSLSPGGRTLVFFPAPPPMKITWSCDNHFHKMHFGKKKIIIRYTFMKERTLRSLVVALNVGWKQLVAHDDVHECLAGDLHAVFDF